MALMFLAPLAAGAFGLLAFVSYWSYDAIRHWRDNRRTDPYIPSRVWFDERYGGTDGDPRALPTRADTPAVPTEGDLGLPPSIRRERHRP